MYGVEMHLVAVVSPDMPRLDDRATGRERSRPVIIAS